MPSPQLTVDFLKYTLTVESSFTVMVTEAMALEEVTTVMVDLPVFSPTTVTVLPLPTTVATLVSPLDHDVMVSLAGFVVAFNSMDLLRPTSVEPEMATVPVVVLPPLPEPPPALQPEGAPLTAMWFCTCTAD